MTSPYAPPTDPLRRLWGPITIRVAWELTRAGVRLQNGVLRDAREHALWFMGVDVDPGVAEDLASAAVADYLARLDGTYARWSADADLEVQPTVAWREALHTESDALSELLIRVHYGDGAPLEAIASAYRLDEMLLRPAREGLREGCRELLQQQGLAAEQWETARIDRMLSRIAAVAGDRCPGPGGLATEQGRAHANHCPRCSRALRLMRETSLVPSDLFPPEDGPCLARSRVELALLSLHPEARAHLKPLLRACGEHALLLSDDLLLIHAPSLPDLEERLRILAENGTPPVHQLRGARAEVEARWCKRLVIGPGPEALRARVSSLAWGEIEGINALPEPLPPPPSAARWWMAALLLVLICASAAGWSLLNSGPAPLVALSAERVPLGVRFDTDPRAFVDIAQVRGRQYALLLHSTTPDMKGVLATGDGAYQLVAPLDPLIVVASPTPLDGLDTLLQELAGEDPRTVSRRIQDRFPGAAVDLVRAGAARGESR